MRALILALALLVAAPTAHADGHKKKVIGATLIAFAASMLSGIGARLAGSHTIDPAMIAAVLLLIPGVPALNALNDVLDGTELGRRIVRRGRLLLDAESCALVLVDPATGAIRTTAIDGDLPPAFRAMAQVP